MAGALLKQWRLLGLILADVRLSPAALTVAYWLLDHRNCETGRCDPSIGRLADEGGLAKRSVLRAIAELEATGWVVRACRPGRRTCYEFAYPAGFGGLAAVAGGDRQAALDVGSQRSLPLLAPVTKRSPVGAQPVTESSPTGDETVTGPVTKRSPEPEKEPKKKPRASDYAALAADVARAVPFDLAPETYGLDASAELVASTPSEVTFLLPKGDRVSFDRRRGAVAS